MFAEEALRALNGFIQPGLFDRFQQIIHRLHPERFDAHSDRKPSPGRSAAGLSDFSRSVLNDTHAVQAGHLHVEKHEIRLEFLDQIDGLQAVFCRSDHLNFGIVF